MGARKITPPQIEHYTNLRRLGWTQKNAASEVGVSEAWAKGYEKNLRDSSGASWREDRKSAQITGPTPLDRVCEEAREALADRTGRLFAKRYFGYTLSPWQAETWEQLEDLWESPEREFLVENVAPGLGKSTVLVMFAAKLTVLHRDMRGLFISRAHSLAQRNVMRLRRALERATPAVGATATLSGDFGRFKPRAGGDVWKGDEFVVEQMDGSPIEEKEPTWAAFGFDSEWLGNRLDVVLGDDLDSTRSTRNFEIVERNRVVFDDELEPRLDPPQLDRDDKKVGGLFVVCQQRLGQYDFSGYCLSKRIVPDDDGSGEAVEGERQYRHIVYRAHYEDRCQGLKGHRTGAPAYPEGCLLDPTRLSWRDLRKAMVNKPRFTVVYQQEDFDDSEVMVPQIWIDGGRGADGIDYPGCWDVNRGACQLPRDNDGKIALDGPLYSFAAADPSPTKYWAVTWLVHHPATGQTFVMDLLRQAMDAPDFLDRVNGQFVGIMEEWQLRSEQLGIPIRTWVVEANAAQRFLLQYRHVKDWQSLRRVNIVPHQTQRNKLDPQFGVQSIAPEFRYGRIRLPGKQHDPGRLGALKLVSEITRWPDTPTDDCVMSLWMGLWNLPNLLPTLGVSRPQKRPSWLRKSA